jgi:xanthine dehydrogenase accessory factor
MNEWIYSLSEQLETGKPCVLVTVAAIRGSAPREAGAKMIVTEQEVIGTIGGGQLEYQCVQVAVRSLQSGEDRRTLRKFTLGANCGQCCGGVVEVFFEPICADKPLWLQSLKQARDRREPILLASSEQTKYLIDARGNCLYPRGATIDDTLRAKAQQVLIENQGAQKMNDEFVLDPIVSSDLHIAIFGAGHVGTAMVNSLSTLDCNVRWIDDRRNIFPERLPDNVQAIESNRPELEVRALPAGAFFLVMTHSHPLDLQIIDQILRRDDFIYCGLIGSVSKRRSFERRLLKLGLAQSRIDKLTCPIGLPGIEGKKPAEIAVAVAAELLQIRSAAARELPENVHLIHRKT